MRIMRSFCFIALTAVIFLVPSCKKETCDKKIETGNFTLQFKAKYGDENFAMNTSNTDPEGRRIKLELLRFYLSHITLIKNDNSEVELKDVALLDFSNPASLSYNLDSISGDFKAIKFGAGLDSIQNLTDPNSVTDAQNPLGNQEMYWTWMKYIFISLQAKADTTTTGAGAFNWSPTYHIGTDAMYRQTELTKDFSVCCNNKYTLTLWLDVEKIFYGTQTLNIITQRTTQMGNGEDPAIAVTFVNNFSQAFETE